MNSRLPEPNLVVLGAQKSGTTSLHEYLKRHPDIFMSSPVKEPGYYLGDERALIFWNRMGAPIENRRQLLRERMLVGYAGQPWFGDASTYYTIGGRSRRFQVPERMKQANPQMRFIYLMRDPVDRIISNYWHCKARGKADGSLADFLMSDEGIAAFRTSQYHEQLRAYRQHFPKEQFCLLLFEDLVERPASVMDRIWRFLDLPDAPGEGEYGVFNESSARDQDPCAFSAAELTNLQRKLKPDLQKLRKHWGVDTTRWSLGHQHGG